MSSPSTSSWFSSPLPPLVLAQHLPTVRAPVLRHVEPRHAEGHQGTWPAPYSNLVIPVLQAEENMNNPKCWNDFYIQFRQSFAKETFSYDEYLKS